MKSQTLQYYMHDGPSAFRFELAGVLDNEGAHELEQAWRTASSLLADRALLVDMTFVTGAEKDGRSLLARWHAEGAQLIAKSKVSRELAEAIVGTPLTELIGAGDPGAGWTWLPFHKSFAALQLVLITALLFPTPAHATNLKRESVDVQSASRPMQDRAHPGGCFAARPFSLLSEGVRGLS